MHKASRLARGTGAGLAIPLAEREGLIERLHEELLLGGLMLPENTITLLKDAETAFYAGADLATLLTAVACLECHLRSEVATPGERVSLAELIERAGFPPELQGRLHATRRLRNRWVHIRDPWDDQHLVHHPIAAENDAAAVAEEAMRAVLSALYSWQWL